MPTRKISTVGNDLSTVITNRIVNTTRAISDIQPPRSSQRHAIAKPIMESKAITSASQSVQGIISLPSVCGNRTSAKANVMGTKLHKRAIQRVIRTQLLVFLFIRISPCNHYKDNSVEIRLKSPIPRGNQLKLTVNLCKSNRLDTVRN